MFLKLDGTFVVQLINFAIFFALLNVVFIRPVSRAIMKRREYINSVTNDYDRYQAEAASCRSEAEAIRAAARREAEQTLAKVRAQASDESANLSAQFNQEAAQLVDRAHQTVNAEMQAARANEPQIVSDLADLMVSRTLTELA
ncbi:MAG TPA: ATP synthase F0 subunit B [Candidatus Baltobacteraceae bacterium]|jgi:F0F1-type ATP synthase membrane subunit b/b'|nr:ATP synthase F0 subunit B [Candidatus Baltobacteraceae bacterium]